MLQLRPTFSESWYRVAALKVRLRPSAQISRQYYRGERWYVVRDPAGNQYHRLSDPAYRFVALLDGSRTINDAWELVGGMMDDEAPTQPEVIQILSQLYGANLIEADVTPDSSVLLKRHRNLMKRKFKQRLMNTLFPRLPLWDPDLYLRRWMPVIGKLMSWWGALLWVLVVGFAMYQLAPMWPDLMQAAKDSVNPGNWLALMAVFVFTKLIHELGHAFATRRWGGECHEMGVMLLVFIPTPYVDASSAWTFPNRWHRVFVGAAGMVVEIFFAALCAFVWMATVGNGEPFAKTINQLAYNAMLIASVSTVLFNANPLLRYDGYYMLSDWLEIPNLQKKSTDYTLGLMKRHLFTVKAKEPLPTVGARIWLFLYSVTSSVYRIFIGIMIIIVVAFQVPILGILMSIGGVITWLGMPIFKSLKYLLIEAELHRKRGRAWAWSGGMLAVAVILIGFVPFPLWVRADGIVEPVRRQVVHTETSGFVDEIAVKDGQAVKAGDVLVRLRDDQLLAEAHQIRASLEAAEIRLRAARAADPAQAAIEEPVVLALRGQLAERMHRITLLEVRADIQGNVVAPQVEQMLGRWVPRGQQVMLVQSQDQLRVVSLVTQGDAELISAKALTNRTEVRVAGAVSRTVAVREVEVVEAATNKMPHPALGYAGGGSLQQNPQDPQGMTSATTQFEVRVYLPENASVDIGFGRSGQVDAVPVVSGQRAFVNVDLPPRSIAWQVWRKFLQLIQSHAASGK
jgi:putative peptide zinc metalloprotease protein